MIILPETMTPTHLQKAMLIPEGREALSK